MLCLISFTRYLISSSLPYILTVDAQKHEQQFTVPDDQTGVLNVKYHLQHEVQPLHFNSRVSQTKRK